jgi:hypothetical protein
MAVPYINILAPSMGGIGPIELSDLQMLSSLSGNGVPFYAGRFYPKDSQAIIDGLQLGLISQTPPWLTWEEIQPTQIWMVPINPDERIVTMNCTIERIDIRPRSMDDYEGMDDATAQELVNWEPPIYGGDVVEKAHGQVNLLPSFNGSLDPGVQIEQNLNFIPPIILNGFLGITQITGRCTEWGFYDQEMAIVNGTQYGQPQWGYGGADELGYDYSEVIKLRPDGAWIKRNADITGDVEIPEFSGPSDAEWEPYIQNSYVNTAIQDYEDAQTIGNAYYDESTKIEGDGVTGNPRAGLIADIRQSEMDTVIYTIKVACTTIVVPDFITGPDEAVRAELAASAVQTFASNLTNNIWYFYLPVRYNGDIPAQRYEQYFSKAGINRVTTDISL